MARTTLREIAQLVPYETMYVETKVNGIRAKLLRAIERNPSASASDIFEKAKLDAVRVFASGGHYMVVDGANRTRAAHEAGLTEVPCLPVISDQPHYLPALEANLAASLTFDTLPSAQSLADRGRATREAAADIADGIDAATSAPD